MNPTKQVSHFSELYTNFYEFCKIAAQTQNPKTLGAPRRAGPEADRRGPRASGPPRPGQGNTCLDRGVGAATTSRVARAARWPRAPRAPARRGRAHAAVKATACLDPAWGGPLALGPTCQRLRVWDPGGSSNLARVL